MENKQKQNKLIKEYNKRYKKSRKEKRVLVAFLSCKK